MGKQLSDQPVKRLDRQSDDALDHSKYLLQPNDKELETKLRLFRVPLSELYPMPPICGFKEIGPVILDPEKQFDPHVGEINKYIHALAPESLDDLKELVGIPNRVVEKRASSVWPREVRLHHLPVRNGFSFESLDQEQRTAVLDMAHNLLYGYADEELISKPPLSGVVEFMLKRAIGTAFFLACDLIVCPDKTIEFKNFSLLYFNNVLVYGSGQVKLGNSTKLHAFQVIHVPVP